MVTRKAAAPPPEPPKRPKRAAVAGKTEAKPVRGPAKASQPRPKKTPTARKTATAAKPVEKLPSKRATSSRTPKKPATLAEMVAAVKKAAAARPGPLERAVRDDVRRAPSTSPVRASLKQVAFALARQLDAGAGMAAAAIAKELRATLDQLTKDDDDRDDELDRFVAALSAEVGDTPTV